MKKEAYSERFTREDGSRIDIAACARKDAAGYRCDLLLHTLLNLPEIIL